ncbi:MAG: Gfo/Idh/MocA family protein [Eubacteriales bacterium]
MRAYNVGVLGFGFMGKTHTYAYRNLPLYYGELPYEIKLKGVCTSSPESAAKAVRLGGFEKGVTDMMELINDKDIDIINICTPNVLHKDALVAALDAGKHIYCDKPITAFPGEAQEVLSHIKGYTGTAQVAFHNRFFPSLMRAAQLVQEGALGRIISFRIAYLHSGALDGTKPLSWRTDTSRSGGGVIMDLGSHALDALSLLGGQIASVCASNLILHPTRKDKDGRDTPITSEDLSVMLLRLESGGIGTLEVSKVATGYDDALRIEIHGERGAVRFTNENPQWLDYCDNTVPDGELGGLHGFTRIDCGGRYPAPASFPSFKSPPGFLRAHVHSLYTFMENVQAGREGNPSLADGAYIQHVMECAYKSAEGAGWVEV